MIFEAIAVAVLVALLSVTGVLFFGTNKRLLGMERFVVPVAVGVFLSLVLYELIPETLEASERWGGLVILLGFVAFYVLAHKLHQRYHHLEAEDCDKKGAAALLLVGDSIHNFADGIILGGAFLIDPTVGVATALALALHEVPQEIVEFGVLLRAGYTKKRALLLNFLSASAIVLGVIVVFALTEIAGEFVWLLTGLAAGNLLFLAASDLLPRIHGNLKNYGSIWKSAGSIVLGFVVMSVLIVWSHEAFGHGDEHVGIEDHSEHADEHTEEEHSVLDEDHTH
jgi:zinc and cadmium transporter